MSAVVRKVVLQCDWGKTPGNQDCSQMATTPRETVRGARNWAEKHGWGCQHLDGGMHPSPSNNPRADDLCPKHFREWKQAKGIVVPPEPDTLETVA